MALIISVAGAAHDDPIKPDDPAYLRRQYAWFQAQEPARQQQLRKLHAEFQELPPDEQAQLTKVMQAYNAWLAKLPEADRQRVLAAPSAADRLDEVKRLRERDWVESLPKVYRDEYARLDADARRQKVQEWRAEEAERHEEWALAQRHWVDPGKVPALLANERAALDTFVGHLRENLTDPERKRLDEARAAMVDEGNYFAYPLEVVRLADQHPLVPWTQVGPKDWGELPDEVKNYLGSTDAEHFAKPGTEPKELRKARGRWPEYALELTGHCRKNELTLPVPLGDSRKEQMPAEVVQFLDKVLEPKLRQAGADGKVDLKLLDEAQGKWPDYPRLVTDLARKYKLSVPGWTLPGPPQFWDRHRAGKGKVK